MKKKILVLFCGGTIVMERNGEGALTPPDKERALSSLFDLEPRIREIADLELSYIANIDSSNVTPELWDVIAQTIFTRYADFDGFVVTHGTDTMGYSASALSFALQNLGKPVVFTGAQIPGSLLESDGRLNLINAVRTAVSNISGVLIVFCEKILLGVRASKVSHRELDAFASINTPPLGSIGVDIRLTHAAHRRHSAPIKLELGFDSKIAVIALVPGMPLSVFEELCSCDLHGIIVIAYGSGNIPEIYLPFLKKAEELKLPVVVRTQCLEGATSMALYASGKKALQFNVIEVGDMSLETTITKLMWTLKRKIPYERVKELMQKNYVGEIS